MGESQLETRTDRVRGSGTDREAGSEREGPNAGEGEGHGRRRLGPFFFFVCVRTRGDTDMEENQGLPELCQGGGQRESEAKKT